MATTAFPATAIFDSGATGRELIQAADQAAAQAAIGVDPSDYGLLDSDNTWTGDNTFTQTLTVSDITSGSDLDISATQTRITDNTANGIYITPSPAGYNNEVLSRFGYLKLKSYSTVDLDYSGSIKLSANSLGVVVKDDLIIDSGGNFKLYKLGTEGDANTQHFEISYGSNNDVSVSTNAAGTGVGGKMGFSTGGNAALNLTLSAIYIYRNFLPSSNSLLCGASAVRWGGVYSVDGDFSGNVNAATFTGDGSGLTNLPTANPFDQSLDTTDSPTFVRSYIGDGVRATPSHTFASQTNMGMYKAATNQLGLVVVNKGLVISTTYAQVGMSSSIGWRAADSIGSGLYDTMLNRDDAGIISQRSTIYGGSQAFRVYGDGDKTNGEWLQIDHGVTHANIATISNQDNGTGTGRHLYIKGADQLRLYSGGNLLHWVHTNTQAIFYRDAIRPNGTSYFGTTGNRWANGYFVAGDFAGTVTANAFVGDGSGLTNLPAGGNPFDQSLNTTDSPSFVDGDFSGTLTTDLIQGGQSQIKLNESASQFLNIWNAAGSIQYFSFRSNAFLPKVSSIQLGLPVSTARWQNVHAVGGSYQNLNVETGGSFKFYNLGDSHTNTTNTESMSLYSTSNVNYFYSAATGSGTVRDLRIGSASNNIWFRNSFGAYIFTAGGSGKLEITSSGVILQSDLFPWPDGTEVCGKADHRWLEVNSVDGDFSGTVDVNRLTFAGDTNTYIQNIGGSDWMAFTVGGLSWLSMNKASTDRYSWFNANQNQTIAFRVGYNGGRAIDMDGANGNVLFGADASVASGGSFKLFNLGDSHTNTTNTEYLETSWDSNAAIIATKATGTGTARAFDISVGSSRRLRGDSAFTYLYGSSGGYIYFGANMLRPQSGQSINIGYSTDRFNGMYATSGNFTVVDSNQIRGTSSINININNVTKMSVGTTSIGYWVNFIPINSGLTIGDNGHYWGNIYSEDGTFSDDVSIGGTLTTDLIEPATLLTLGEQNKNTVIKGAYVRLCDGANLMLNIDSSYVTIYGNGIRASHDDTRPMGYSSRIWSEVWQGAAKVRGSYVDASNYGHLSIAPDGDDYLIKANSLGTTADASIKIQTSGTSASGTESVILDADYNGRVQFFFGGNVRGYFNKSVLQANVQVATNTNFVINRTWNNAATVFQGFDANITDTASDAESSLLDLKVGGTSYLRLRKDGDLLFEKNGGSARIVQNAGGIAILGDNGSTVQSFDQYFNYTYKTFRPISDNQHLGYVSRRFLVKANDIYSKGKIRSYNLGDETAVDAEYLNLHWLSDHAYLTCEATGTGTARQFSVGTHTNGSIRFNHGTNTIRFSVGGVTATKMYLNSSGLTLYGVMSPQGQKTRDLGTTAARWRELFVGDIDADGTCTATAFVGDGSGLTGLPSGSSTLSGLTDTNVSSPANGNLLIYDAVSSKWDNALLTSSDSSVTITVGAGTINLAAGGVGPSDARLKENVKEIENALGKVSKMLPVEFDWKEGFDDVHSNKGKDIGFIAQDIEEIQPELVGSHKDYKTLQYEKFAPLIIGAIKELSNQIQEIKSKLG